MIEKIDVQFIVNRFYIQIIKVYLPIVIVLIGMAQMTFFGEEGSIDSKEYVLTSLQYAIPLFIFIAYFTRKELHIYAKRRNVRATFDTILLLSTTLLVINAVVLDMATEQVSGMLVLLSTLGVFALFMIYVVSNQHAEFETRIAREYFSCKIPKTGNTLLHGVYNCIAYLIIPVSAWLYMRTYPMSTLICLLCIVILVPAFLFHDEKRRKGKKSFFWKN